MSRSAGFDSTSTPPVPALRWVTFSITSVSVAAAPLWKNGSAVAKIESSEGGTNPAGSDGRRSVRPPFVEEGRAERSHVPQFVEDLPVDHLVGCRRRVEPHLGRGPLRSAMALLAISGDEDGASGLDRRIVLVG